MKLDSHLAAKELDKRDSCSVHRCRANNHFPDYGLNILKQAFISQLCKELEEVG